MKILSRVQSVGFVVKVVIVVMVVIAGSFCGKPIIDDGTDDVEIPENCGTLEVDFEIPIYRDIQKGIRRVDLAVCYSMYEMSKEEFFYRTNVSDAKQIYQINLPEGSYYYRVAITCTCSADSCINGGFPYGYGGMKYAFDEITIEKGKRTVSKPSFQ
ncbi:MAG: hypothetical protein NTV01_21540 [Bacteroidia bacterium]|nr:hypothetical protein [Bacteroidia bacterium]